MKPLIAIDWDGTLVEAQWPHHGDWMPGAVEAVKAFLEAGFLVTVFTLRVHPIELDGLTPRATVEIRRQHDIIRDKLDNAGLREVSIYMEPGKPPAELFIDDRAMYFPGRHNSWKTIQKKALMKLGSEVDLFAD